MKSYRRWGEPGPWQSFSVAFIFLLVFPLLPLGAELLFTGRVTASSLTLVTSTYAISLAMSSRNVVIWAIGFLIGIGFGVIFGWSMGVGDSAIGPVYRLTDGPTADPGWLLWAGAGVAIVFVMHVLERFNRHVMDGEPFPEFMRR